MNQKATYELTITSKLEQLPIPDLREAIWSRIEGALDADLPTDDGGDAPPSSPNGGLVLRLALPGVIVIIITLLLIKANKKNNAIPASTTPSNTPFVTASPTASPPSVDTNTLIRNTKAPVVYPGTNVPVSVTGNSTDSAAPPVTDIIPPLSDNTNQQAAPLVQTPLPVPLKTDTVAAKKKRGVQGITDNDYRIVPVKDSTKKN